VVENPELYRLISRLWVWEDPPTAVSATLGTSVSAVLGAPLAVEGGSTECKWLGILLYVIVVLPPVCPLVVFAKMNFPTRLGVPPFPSARVQPVGQELKSNAETIPVGISP